MWKAKITVDAAGLEVKRALMKTINVLCLALLSLQDIPTPMLVLYACGMARTSIHSELDLTCKAGEGGDDATTE